MKFARLTFIIGGIWGIAVLTPLFFLFDITGRPYPAPTDYPHFFYGFLLVALVWQLAFLLIGSNPQRFRLMMIPAILEKLTYVTMLAVLYAGGRIDDVAAQAAIPDGLLGVLFIVSFVKTRT